MTTWTDIENRFKEICNRYTKGNEGNQEVIANALLRRLEKALEEDNARSSVTEAEMFSNGVTNNDVIVDYLKAIRITSDGCFKINNQCGAIQPRRYDLKDLTDGRVVGKFFSVRPLDDIIEKMKWIRSLPDDAKITGIDYEVKNGDRVVSHTNTTTGGCIFSMDTEWNHK